MKRTSRRNSYTINGLDEFPKSQNFGESLVFIQPQINHKTNPKHIYRSLRVLLNSTLTRNVFESFQTQPIHKIEGSKPCIDTFYTKTRQIPCYSILKSIPVIFFFPSFFLLFFSSSSSSSSLLFSSLLSYPFLLFLSARPK